LLQDWLVLDWGGLSVWQNNGTYKLVSGSLLALFLASQWLLAVCRWQGWNRMAKSTYVWHQRSGILAPGLLFLHSTKLGFGYILVLACTYLANTLIGLLSPHTFPGLRRWQTPWMATHVALSILLVVMTGYHAWTALYFE
jgi:hypothetical protein